MSRTVRSYTDLDVWRLGMEIADVVYDLTAAFPKDETFGLTAQVRRAAVSVPSNVAEGWGRQRTNEYVQFLRYARGSLYEVETQMRIAARRRYLSDGALAALLEQTDEEGRKLLALIRPLTTPRPPTS